MLEQLERITIGDDEAPVIPLDEIDICTGILESRNSVVGCMFRGREINLTRFKVAMSKIWGCGSFEIQKLDEHFFQLFFLLFIQI